MKKIWAKVLTDDRRIKQDMIYVLPSQYDKADLYEYLCDICTHMHLATPLVLSVHENMFDEYSFVRFTAQDFVEGIDFFALTLESGD